MKWWMILVLAVIAYMVFDHFSSKKAAEENRVAGTEFLKKNIEEEGVEATPTGLQWKVLQAGTGTVHPSATSQVTVHYHGTLINGTVFDSSVERGKSISFGLNRVIKGWTEGVQLMVEGEKRRLFIPADLAYGNRSAGKIPPGSTIIFDVELIKVHQGLGFIKRR